MTDQTEAEGMMKRAHLIVEQIDKEALVAWPAWWDKAAEIIAAELRKGEELAKAVEAFRKAFNYRNACLTTYAEPDKQQFADDCMWAAGDKLDAALAAYRGSGE